MSITAICLGVASYSPPVGVPRIYDQMPSKPEKADGPMLQKATPSLVRQGNKQREKIMALIDEYGDVDMQLLRCEMDISVTCIRKHLARLGDAIVEVRNGRFISWKRPVSL